MAYLGRRDRESVAVLWKSLISLPVAAAEWADTVSIFQPQVH